MSPSATVRLMTSIMSRLAVPANGGLASAIDVLTHPEKLKAIAGEAKEQTRLAILAVRESSDPNPWRESSDEEIAAEIMRQVEARSIRRSVSQEAVQ